MGAQRTEMTYTGRIRARTVEVIDEALKHVSEDELASLAFEFGGHTSNGPHRTWSSVRSAKGALVNIYTGTYSALWGIEAFQYAATGVLMAALAGHHETVERLKSDLAAAEERNLRLVETLAEVRAKATAPTVSAVLARLRNGAAS